MPQINNPGGGGSTNLHSPTAIGDVAANTLTGTALAIVDSGNPTGNRYDFTRNGSTGVLEVQGTQGAFSGVMLRNQAAVAKFLFDGNTGNVAVGGTDITYPLTVTGTIGAVAGVFSGNVSGLALDMSGTARLRLGMTVGALSTLTYDDTNKELYAGSNAASSSGRFYGGIGQLQARADGGGSQASVRIQTAGGANYLTLDRANGTFTSPTALLSGDVFGTVIAVGAFDSGPSMAHGGEIVFATTENWDSTHNGAQIEFFTIPTGGTTRTSTLLMNGGSVTARGALNLGGTAGAGFLDSAYQSSAPSTPAASHTRFYFDATGRLAWVKPDGFTRTFDGAANTASRVYTLPDANSSFPICAQFLTFSGPTAARTITLPDQAFTAAGLEITQTFTGIQTLTPTARTSGALSYFTLTTPADTAQTASTECIGANFTAATRQFATGALTTQRERVFAAPTYSFVGASTLTTAINVDIADPVAGTNATIANKIGLRAVTAQLTGAVTMTAGTANSNNSTTTGTLVVTGGIGSSSNITAAGHIHAQTGIWISPSGYVQWTDGTTNRATMYSVADGKIQLTNNAANGFTILQFGVTTSSGAAFQTSGTAITAGLADGTAGGSFTASGTLAVTGATTLTGLLTANGGMTMADATNFIVGSTTGTKWGTATSQKQSFWNATPIIQPAAALQAAITNSTGGTQDGTLVDVTTATVADPAKINSNFTDVYALLDAIRTALVNSGLMKGAA